jgi:transposase
VCHRALLGARVDGHKVRLMPAKDVKAYVKRNKNDAADAEAICEAVRCPTMRFVRVKTAEQQGQLMQHRTRDLLMRQRTQLINALRAHLAELGIVAAQGREGSRSYWRSSQTPMKSTTLGHVVFGLEFIASLQARAACDQRPLPPRWRGTALDFTTVFASQECRVLCPIL